MTRMTTRKTQTAPGRQERRLSQLDTQLDWNSIAPEVALRLKGEPRTKSNTEWRWGNKGSFAFYLENATFRDYEAGVSGGVVTMVSHCEGLDKQGAIQWLKDNDFLPQIHRTTRARPQIHKSKPASHPTKTPHDHGNLPYGLRLWNEARSVPAQDDHPVRLWSRGLLPPTTPMPDAIRFHRERRFIVCCVATLANWLDAYRRYTYAPSGARYRYYAARRKTISVPNGRATTNAHSAASMAADSSSSVTRAVDTINLCEGVTDALAIHQREPGAVIASLTTFTKLISHFALIKHIAARNPVIFPDMDDAGKNSTDDLTQALK